MQLERKQRNKVFVTTVLSANLGSNCHWLFISITVMQNFGEGNGVVLVKFREGYS